MRRKKPVVIDVTDYRVIGETPPREPIIKSWAALWWFVGPTAAIFMVQVARIKGWF